MKREPDKIGRKSLIIPLIYILIWLGVGQLFE